MKINRFMGSAIALACAFAITAPAAFASGTTGGDTSAQVTGGSLAIIGAITAPFTDATITGIAQVTTAPLDVFSVSDLTGTGAGWHVTAEASNFDGVTHNLGASSLLMTAPTVGLQEGTTSPAPSITDGPYTIDSGTAVSIASAALTHGMGTYNFSATTLTLALPGNVYADDYDSTVTISAITAP